MLRRFADFSVANGDLLFDPTVTRSTTAPVAGRQRGRRRGRGAGLPEPTSGAIWVRVATSGIRLVVTLVDLRSQQDARWNYVDRGLTSASGLGSPRRGHHFGHPMAGPALPP